MPTASAAIAARARGMSRGPGNGVPFERSSRPSGRDGSTETSSSPCAGCALPSMSTTLSTEPSHGVSPFTSADHRVVPGGDRGAILRAERGEREADGREIRPGVERVAELLEQDRLLEEAEADASLVLADGDAEPAELCELRPAVVLRRVPVAVERIALGEPRACLALQLELARR